MKINTSNPTWSKNSEHSKTYLTWADLTETWADYDDVTWAELNFGTSNNSPKVRING